MLVICIYPRSNTKMQITSSIQHIAYVRTGNKTWKNIHMYVWICICMYVCMYIYIYIYLYNAGVHTNICMYTCVYMSKHEQQAHTCCAYIHTYVHRYRQVHGCTQVFSPVAADLLKKAASKEISNVIVHLRKCHIIVYARMYAKMYMCAWASGNMLHSRSIFSTHLTRTWHALSTHLTRTWHALDTHLTRTWHALDTHLARTWHARTCGRVPGFLYPDMLQRNDFGVAVLRVL